MPSPLATAHERLTNVTRSHMYARLAAAQVFALAPPSRSDTEMLRLTPLARYLGPQQRRLHRFMVFVRIVQRVLSWEVSATLPRLLLPSGLS